MMLCLLDANIFITAARCYYGMDFCPGFWDWLARRDGLASIQKVREELLMQEDELAEWVQSSLPEDMFITPSEQTMRNYSRIAKYVDSLTEFKEPAKNAFLGGADGWLIAEAMTCGGTIVTNETYDENCRRKIKLPNVASHFNVGCSLIFQVMREQNVRLRLIP